MGLKRSISNLSKASFSTYFYVFASLLCDWGEALFGHDDYYRPGINQIPTAHCVYVFLFPFLLLYFLLMPVFTVQGELLQSTFVPPFSYIIVLLMAKHSMLHLKEPAKEITIFHFLLFLFVCFGTELDLILLGHFWFVWAGLFNNRNY